MEDLINFSGGLSSTASGKAILRQSIPLNERIVEDLTSDVKSVDLLKADQIKLMMAQQSKFYQYIKMILMFKFMVEFFVLVFIHLKKIFITLTMES